jgi:hypothetical protein
MLTIINAVNMLFLLTNYIQRSHFLTTQRNKVTLQILTFYNKKGPGQ